MSEPTPTFLASWLEDDRLLLLSAPSANSPALEEQMALLNGTAEKRKSLDVKLGRLLRQGESRIEDQALTDQEYQELEQHYSLENCFEVLLIEKGGKLLHRDDAPLKPKAIFSHFDATSTGRQKGTPRRSA